MATSYSLPLKISMIFRITPPRQSDVSSFPTAFASYVPRSRKVYGCILISPCDRILLVRGKLSGKWSLPKGHMEGRETDLQCALRELYEETGITPNVKYSFFKKFAAGGYFIFFMNDEPCPLIQCGEEISEVGWYDVSEIKKLPCNLDLNCFSRWIKKNCFRTDPDPCNEIIVDAD